MSISEGNVSTKLWRDVYPELLLTEVKADEFCSPDVFKEECERVFGQTWLFAGRTDDLTAPGNFFEREFPALRASIILARGLDDKIRAFHNVCRHRCAKLLPRDARGKTRSFTCEFHGWRYDLEGYLAALPDPDGRLEKLNLKLVEIPAEVWKGFIFVNFSKKPTQTFADFLGPLATHHVNKFGLDGDLESWAWRVRVNANWKIVRDLFAETYHVSFVHAQSVRDIYADPKNRYFRVPLIKFYGHHGMFSFYSSQGQPSRIGPVAGLSVKHGGKENSRYGKAKDSAPGLNPENLDNWGSDFYHIFPNLGISIFGSLWHYHLFEPVDANTTIWENRIFFPKAKNAGMRFAHEFSKSLQIIVGLEDLAAAERNQLGVATGAVPELSLHDHEILLRFFRKTMSDFISEHAEAGR